VSEPNTAEPNATEEPPPRGEIEQWVYMGVHPTAAGTHLWRTPNNEQLAYKKLTSRAIGGVHTLRVERKDDHIYVLGGDVPRWSGEFAEDSAAIQLQAASREDALRIKRLMNNTSRMQTIDDALAPLLEIASSLPIHTDRDTLVQYVTRRIYAAQRKRKS
jgi:hypothetical protein